MSMYIIDKNINVHLYILPIDYKHTLIYNKYINKQGVNDMYYRYADAENAINDYAGFGMFAANENRVSDCYGDHRFLYDGTDGISIYDLREKIMNAWEDYRDCAPDYMQDMTAEEFFNSFNPEDIVNDAEAWDNGDFRQFFSDFIYDFESAIILDDGAIVFDENLIMG